MNEQATAPPAIEEDILGDDLTPWQRVRRNLAANRLAMAGGFFLFLFLALALAGWWGTMGTDPYLNPSQVRLPDKLKPPLAPPNRGAVPPEALPRLGVYLFGTDELGRDVFARMLEGATVSMAVGFVAVGIAIVLGIMLGGIAGFYGGRFRSVDTAFLMLVDVQISFPTFFLILTVIALLPPSIWNIMIVIGLTGWVGPARFVRAEILSLRERPFIEAAVALGGNDFRLIFLHLVPNSLAPVLVSATIGIASAILTEAGLSFLGFGVPPPQATWGNILSDGKKYLFDAPWLTFIPGTAILLVVLAFNLFGEGLRDALNPRAKPE